jgi:hypothetical protein
LLVSDDPAVLAFTGNWRRSIHGYAQELAGD